jgi:hypothetical protein
LPAGRKGGRRLDEMEFGSGESDFFVLEHGRHISAGDCAFLALTMSEAWPTSRLIGRSQVEISAMICMERLAFKKRFGSPAALAVLDAFAAPEPLGAIMLICAAVWWWRSRRATIVVGTNAARS